MNWMGGSRRRVKAKEEAGSRQREFFAKRRLGSYALIENYEERIDDKQQQQQKWQSALGESDKAPTHSFRPFQENHKVAYYDAADIEPDPKRRKSVSNDLGTSSRRKYGVKLKGPLAKRRSMSRNALTPLPQTYKDVSRSYQDTKSRMTMRSKPRTSKMEVELERTSFNSPPTRRSRNFQGNHVIEGQSIFATEDSEANMPTTPESSKQFQIQRSTARQDVHAGYEDRIRTEQRQMDERIQKQIETQQTIMLNQQKLLAAQLELQQQQFAEQIRNGQPFASLNAWLGNNREQGQRDATNSIMPPFQDSQTILQDESEPIRAKRSNFPLANTFKGSIRFGSKSKDKSTPSFQEAGPCFSLSPVAGGFNAGSFFSGMQIPPKPFQENNIQLPEALLIQPQSQLGEPIRSTVETEFNPGSFFCMQNFVQDSSTKMYQSPPELNLQEPAGSRAWRNSSIASIELLSDSD